MRIRIILLCGAITVAAAGVVLACGQTASGGNDGVDGSTGADAATGTVGAACFPNSTCFAPLQCVSGVCITRDGDGGPNPPAEAGAGCGTVPAFASGCFAMGHNACPDGTCVDFVEAGCPPIVDFSGTWPLQCGKNADCVGTGHCCAGTSFSGPLKATAADTCVVDTVTDSFYTKATICSASACVSPVCTTSSDCDPGQHCAVMKLTTDPKGPVVGVCVN